MYQNPLCFSGMSECTVLQVMIEDSHNHYTNQPPMFCDIISLSLGYMKYIANPERNDVARSGVQAGASLTQL